jgi:FkbM family methyltransferase
VPQQTISYAQRYEDIHLLRCFDRQATGFYIDVGAGHPVYDNVSFLFYLRGWSGITVEPNPWLAELSAAVRPRDTRIASLLGAEEGEATYYLVEDFHGLSTTVEHHARAAHSEFGKRSRPMTVAVTTLAALCERHAPDTIDFLKLDVEGAERAVLEGGDWRRFRPKVVVAEALAPVTLSPSFEEWEPLLTDNDYQFALFDGLNRYYVAREHVGLAQRLAAPTALDGIAQVRAFRPALDDPSHPDHRLARLCAGEDMVRLPLLGPNVLAERLLTAISAAEPDRPAQPADGVDLHQRMFGAPPPPGWAASLNLPPNASLRDLCERAVATDAARAAFGRISASYAW